MSTAIPPVPMAPDGHETSAVAEAAHGIEQRGIDYIPSSERRGKPSDLFWMWAGALWNIEYVVYGALIVSIGLSFWQAFLIIILGNLTYFIAGLGSLQGPAAGTAVFTIHAGHVRTATRSRDLHVQLGHTGGIRGRGPLPDSSRGPRSRIEGRGECKHRASRS